MLWNAIATDLDRGGPILDIGCGTGYWLEVLCRRGVSPSRLLGVDLDPVRVAAAASRVAGSRVAIADAAELPFKDGQVDCALLFLVLSSLRHEQAVAVALREARRVVGTGVIAIWEPRLPNPFNRDTRLVTRREREAVLGAADLERTLTLFPPLARALGPRAASWYPRLTRLPPARTHRLAIHRV